MILYHWYTDIIIYIRLKGEFWKHRMIISLKQRVLLNRLTKLDNNSQWNKNKTFLKPFAKLAFVGPSKMPFGQQMADDYLTS